MTPDSAGLGAADRDLAMLAASASATGERLQSAANAALLAVLASDLFGLLAIPGAARGTPVIAAALLGTAALAIWSWQTLLAVRLALDTQVFRAFALGPGERLEPGGFDRALARAGLRPAGPPRSMQARWLGARRLLVQQAICLSALVLTAITTLAWIGANA